MLTGKLSAKYGQADLNCHRCEMLWTSLWTWNEVCITQEIPMNIILPCAAETFFKETMSAGRWLADTCWLKRPKRHQPETRHHISQIKTLLIFHVEARSIFVWNISFGMMVIFSLERKESMNDLKAKASRACHVSSFWLDDLRISVLTDAVDTLNVRHARAGSEKDEARSQSGAGSLWILWTV